MEEADELVPEPDSKGFLSLTNRAWVNLDPMIWKMSLKIVTLDLSYNSIFEIPPQIGEMQLLRELRCSVNKISVLPREIGRINRLRRLYLNGNRIRSLPEEIGRLQLLEELVLSENSLEDLPKTISNIAALRVLKLQNNKLHNLPYELADLQVLFGLSCCMYTYLYITLSSSTSPFLCRRWRS
jgi:leucine-rich repeat protein SHOC2